MGGKIQVIVGGQFGSEGKGHAAAELAAREGQMLAVRTGGPNAGHTVYDENGTQFKLRQVPVAAVVNPQAVIALAPRSVVQLDLAGREVKEVNQPVLVIDSNATVLEPAHITVERGDSALAWGSTQKGIGAARMDRVHRTARTWREAAESAGYEHTRLAEGDVTEIARNMLSQGHTVQIEAAQGYGLGLHTSFYPKTTSADCRAIDALADLGVSPWELPQLTLDVWVVIRPNPIRVAGESGPLKDETTWEALGLPEERTTVTNKVRRVGGWDPALVRNAVRANGTRHVKLWLNMADHVFPELAGQINLGYVDGGTRDAVQRWTHEIWKQTGATVGALGTGPDTAILLGEA